MRANATTTPEMRAYIQASDKPVGELAKEFGVSPTTIRRWRARTTANNASRAPKRQAISLSKVEVRLICELRTQGRPSVDDITDVMRRCVNAELSVYRSLQRSGLNRDPLVGDTTANGTNQTDAVLVRIDLDHQRAHPCADSLFLVHSNRNASFADGPSIRTDDKAADHVGVDADKPRSRAPQPKAVQRLGDRDGAAAFRQPARSSASERSASQVDGGSLGLISYGAVPDDRCTAVTPTDSNSLAELSAPQVQHVSISATEPQVASRPRPINSLGRYALMLWLVGAAVYGLSTQTFLRAIDAFSQKDESSRVSAKKRVAAKPAIPRTKQTTDGASADASAVSVASLVATAEAALARQPEAASSATNASATAPANVDATATGGEWVEISGSGVNLRAGPSSATNVVTVQSLGIKLRVLSRERGWIEVINPETGQKGWIFHRYTRPSGSPPDDQQTDPSITGATQ